MGTTTDGNRSVRAVGLGLVSALALAGPTGAAAPGPDFFRTAQGAAALSLRAGPSPGADVLGTVPAGADGLANLGCKGDTAAAAHWCLVGYGQQAGWLPGTALAKGSGEDPPAIGSEAESLDRSEWRTASPISEGAERYVKIGPREGMVGNGGCNEFHGRFEQDGDALSIGPLVIRPTACRDQMVEAETDFLSALALTHRGVVFYQVLVLLDDQGTILMHLIRDDRD